MGGSAAVVPILLFGATGRMGRAIRAALAASEASERGRFSLRGCVARSHDGEPHPEGCVWFGPDALGKPEGLASLPPDLVVVDVSLASGTETLLGALEALPRALVAATSGLSPATEERIARLAARAPVLRARNLSPGIAVLSAVLRALPPGARGLYDADVVEHHHAAKKDAPSGTAIALGELLRGVGTERRPGGVATHSLRGGSAPGTHEIVLSGEGETLTLGHAVQDRAVFARGALRAARFLHGRKPGLYSFEDALTEA
ncbi:MAG TPA: dihydrodipicolinate reductase C-terminal domain-containing protein [Candidatus Binatia bacterium]|nr:dihydrodipicolinate reductase C-terminal domain-containing protein [Candidatus Binatia bacterium]